MELTYLAKLASIVWLDIVLSGDNALVIGLAASTLPAGLRTRAIVFGLVLATTLRILFAAATTYLLGIPGLLFAGGLALLWVSWSLYCEVRRLNGTNRDNQSNLNQGGAPVLLPIDGGANGGHGRALSRALVAITVADVSMSLDNVLAVAAIAREHIELLIFGLGLSIALMGIGATLIMRLLIAQRWISYVGVIILVYIAGRMLWDGWPDFYALLVHTWSLFV